MAYLECLPLSQLLRINIYDFEGFEHLFDRAVDGGHLDLLLNHPLFQYRRAVDKWIEHGGLATTCITEGNDTILIANYVNVLEHIDEVLVQVVQVEIRHLPQIFLVKFFHVVRII